MHRFRTVLPGVEAAPRHEETPTQHRDRVLGLLRRDEPKSHRLCFAKKAAAFFNISRSSWRMRFSLRSRASSSRSAVVSAPGLPLPRSARVCSTHLRNDDSVKSRSRAAAPTVFPSSSTSRTAPALNSSLKLRRVRLGCLSAIVDIVSAFRKVSTKPDQAQNASETEHAFGV